MPEIEHDDIDAAVREILAGFTAAQHFHDRHIPLSGPEILYAYKVPEQAVEQGVLAVFKAGDVPVITMVLERHGDEVDVRAAKLTDERVEVFFKGQDFSDIENNYVFQPLWVSAVRAHSG